MTTFGTEEVKERLLMRSLSQLKRDVKNALIASDFKKIGRLCRDDRKVFSVLISLAYDKEDVLCWRAIEAMGKAAAAVAADDPASVRKVVQRLLWSLSDESGGVAWSGPEMLAEIVVNTPSLCSDIPPIILSLQEEDIFLKGVLWSMGRVITSGTAYVEGAEDFAFQYLGDEDPAVRGLALNVLSGNRRADVTDRIKGMVRDDGRFRIYRNHELVETTVGDAAREALK
jgi:hypothetical protein